MMMQAPKHVVFFTIFFIKRALLKRFNFYENCCNQAQFLNKKFFTTPNSKNITATLCIVTIERSELKFLLILHFHGYS